MRRLSPLSAALLLFLIIQRPLGAQNDTVSQAREAMDRGMYTDAVRLLSSSIASQPSADAYVYLGISYANIREWTRAEETLKEGSTRYPNDPRFHNELAGVYLASNDIAKARDSLKRALGVDPENKYAADLLASVDMSVGDVKGALEAWNRDGRPVIGDVLHNGHVEFENITVRKAAAFHTGDTLTWNKWRTTEVRLQSAWLFASQGLEIEPTTSPDRYTAVIRTTPKTNGAGQLVVTLLEAGFFKSPTIRFWNVGDSTVSLRANYRFATDRHRGELGVMAPLPLPGLLLFEAAGFFRSERWDISRPALDTGFDHRFLYKSTGVRGEIRHIPHYRIDLRLGYEYRNRTASGAQPGLALDSRNTGKMLVKAGFLPFEGRFRSRIYAEGFMARRTFLSDIDFSGGTLEWDNRILFDKDGKNTLEIDAKTGTSRGELPVDEYFILGIRPPTQSDIYLRGHSTISTSGHYGDAPMGTSFTLVNATFDRRIRRLPFFNVLNDPYVDLKWLIFVDGGRSFDRAKVFEEGKLLIDVGGGFRLETPTRTFNLTYGRSLRDGTGVLAAYVGRRW